MSSDHLASLDRDEIFEILSSHRRRMVLYYLRENNHEATMDELADQVAAWENEITIDELDSQQRKRVYVSLYQTHLPKLADADFIEYDADEGDTRLTSNGVKIDAYLAPKQAPSYPWERYYLVFVLFSGALVILGTLVTLLFDTPILLWIAAGVIIGYLASTAVEYWDYRKVQAEIPDELVPQHQ